MISCLEISTKMSSMDVSTKTEPSSSYALTSNRSKQSMQSCSVDLLIIGLEFLGDAESVHGVVVDVDEGFVAVVHSGDELTHLCKVV